MGIGGAPEGVITAAALRCLGGEIQARLVFRSDAERERAQGMGHGDPTRVYRTDELASGENVVFAATGVTKGDLLEGVRFFGGGARTHSLVMAYQTKQVRFVDTVHMFDRNRPRRSGCRAVGRGRCRAPAGVAERRRHLGHPPSAARGSSPRRHRRAAAAPRAAEGSHVDRGDVGGETAEAAQRDTQARGRPCGRQLLLAEREGPEALPGGAGDHHAVGRDVVGNQAGGQLGQGATIVGPGVGAAPEAG